MYGGIYHCAIDATKGVLSDCGMAGHVFSGPLAISIYSAGMITEATNNISQSISRCDFKFESIKFAVNLRKILYTI